MPFLFESPADILTDPGLDWAVTEALDRGDEAQTVADRFGMTLYAVQAICGERGHEYETHSHGDPNDHRFLLWSACIICGAPDEREGDEP